MFYFEYLWILKIFIKWVCFLCSGIPIPGNVPIPSSFHEGPRSSIGAPGGGYWASRTWFGRRGHNFQISIGCYAFHISLNVCWFYALLHVSYLISHSFLMCLEWCSGCPRQRLSSSWFQSRGDWTPDTKVTERWHQRCYSSSSNQTF